MEKIYYGASVLPLLPPPPPDNDISVRANEMGQFSNSLQTQYWEGLGGEKKKMEETEGWREYETDGKHRLCISVIVFVYVLPCLGLQVCVCGCCVCFLSASPCVCVVCVVCYVCFECTFFFFFFFDVCVRCASTQPKAKLTDSFPLRSPLVFLIDRHNAKVQAPSLVPMLIAASCIFMSSLGINQLNKGWGRWLGAAFITDSDWLERQKKKKSAYKDPCVFFLFFFFPSTGMIIELETRRRKKQKAKVWRLNN